jgi:hypothetical protein
MMVYYLKFINYEVGPPQLLIDTLTTCIIIGQSWRWCCLKTKIQLGPNLVLQVKLRLSISSNVIAFRPTNLQISLDNLHDTL